MQLISSVTVGAGGSTSIAFNSIPQTFTDLVLVSSTRTGGSDGSISLRFNGSASTYAARFLYGTGTSALSGTTTFAAVGKANASGTTANTFANSVAYIPNYTGSSTKLVNVDYVSENNGAAAFQFLVINSWDGTAAITSMALTTPNDVAGFSQHSTFYLYGITKGSGGATVS